VRRPQREYILTACRVGSIKNHAIFICHLQIENYASEEIVLKQGGLDMNPLPILRILTSKPLAASADITSSSWPPCKIFFGIQLDPRKMPPCLASSLFENSELWNRKKIARDNLFRFGDPPLFFPQPKRTRHCCPRLECETNEPKVPLLFMSIFRGIQ